MYDTDRAGHGMQDNKQIKRKGKYFAIVSLIIVLLLLTVVFLSGCVRVKKEFKYNSSVIDPEAVTSILFFDYSFTESTGGPSFPVHPAFEQYGYSYDSNEPDPIYTLPQEKIAPFLEELSAIKFVSSYTFILGAYDPYYMFGDYFIRVNFADGSFSYIADRFYRPYDAEGQYIVGYYGNPACKTEKEFDALVAKFLPVEE